MNLKISNSTKTYTIDYLEEIVSDVDNFAVESVDYEEFSHFEVQSHRPMSLPTSGMQLEASV